MQVGSIPLNVVREHSTQGENFRTSDDKRGRREEKISKRKKASRHPSPPFALSSSRLAVIVGCSLLIKKGGLLTSTTECGSIFFQTSCLLKAYLLPLDSRVESFELSDKTFRNKLLPLTVLVVHKGARKSKEKDRTEGGGRGRCSC